MIATYFYGNRVIYKTHTNQILEVNCSFVRYLYIVKQQSIADHMVVCSCVKCSKDMSRFFYSVNCMFNVVNLFVISVQNKINLIRFV